MKILTWNVNGIRAALKKDLKNWIVSQDSDVICFQETKARPEQLTEEQRDFSIYKSAVWNSAQRAGYSGVATFSKREPLEIQVGIGDSKFDVEGRVIRTKYEDFYLYNVYFPNGQRGKERVDYKLDFYNYLLDVCKTHRAAGENVILTGDFNTARAPIDLANPKGNEKTSGFLPAERAVLEKFFEIGFVDPFRVLYPDKIQYTWWTYRFNARQRNIGWRIDYFLISEKLIKRAKDVMIHDDVSGSDHCPVTLYLD